MGRLKGKVAVITGAGSGIGLAIAQRYADEEAVVVGYDLQEADGWSDVEKAAPGALFRQGDVRDGDAQIALANEVVEQFGRIDILVTAAGVAGGGPVHLVSEEEWDRVQDINLKGTYLSAKAVLPTMIEQRSGSIITIASVEGLEAQEGGSTYNASKGGVVLLMKNMAIDYGRVGIRSNAICPGFIETPMFDAVMGGEALAEFKEKVREQHKLGRFGKPEEIAGAAFFLGSDDSSFVTGQAIAVDGGFTAGKWFGITKMFGLE
ncbi:MAG: NAD(P)-dependent dehydrogenase (short-subunit alcohol dehydrogenase family) [Myxococcota bacterium]|jgi:NAD(P)-dependent dehydrogenase (short-subunit alcohol dehydrogenase family)